MIRLPKWGAILSAGGYALAWVCCVPAAFGAGGAALAVVGEFLGPFRPLLFGLSFLFLAVGLIQTARRRRCRLDSSCESAGWREWAPLLLAAFIVAVLVTFPWWSGWLFYWLM